MIKAKYFIYLLFTIMYKPICSNTGSITEGQFEYDVIACDLNFAEIGVDSTEFTNDLSSKFKTHVSFNENCIAFSSQFGIYQQRTVVSNLTDSVYIFVDGFEKTYSATSKVQFEKQAKEKLDSLNSSPLMHADTISKENIGLDKNGIENIKVVISVNGNPMECIYAQNLPINVPFPIHRFPFLQDKVLTKAEICNARWIFYNWDDQF